MLLYDERRMLTWWEKQKVDRQEKMDAAWRPDLRWRLLRLARWMAVVSRKVEPCARKMMLVWKSLGRNSRAVWSPDAGSQHSNSIGSYT